MTRCPITYELCDNGSFSELGLTQLAPALEKLFSLDLTTDELHKEAKNRATGMSIPGAQPKLNAVLSIKKSRFEIADHYGRFILKPQHPVYAELPENEDLTMKMARICGIEVPMHGMVRSKDQSLTYFIRRFDRIGQRDKLAVEDFAQLGKKTRETKYDYSMEKLVGLLDRYCTFPAIEKEELFRRVLFSFLVGNEDMHLKNYSVIIREGIVKLSPAYDLLNSTIIQSSGVEEIALPLQEKTSNLTREILVEYLGKKCCGLTNKSLEKTLFNLKSALPAWLKLIKISFLSSKMKEKYVNVLYKRSKILEFNS